MKSKGRSCRHMKRFFLFLIIFFGSSFSGSELLYRLSCKAWYFQDRASSAKNMLRPHPYTGAALVPGKIAQRDGVIISHNQQGFRGAPTKFPKPNGVFRIVTLGGSSTYGTGVSDNETWQAFLTTELGDGVEIINLGIPGATSIEALIQSAFWFSELRPDLALYYMGWNDARVQHVQGLAADWSDTHGKWMLAYPLKSNSFQARTAFGYYLNNFMINHLVLSKLGNAEMRSWPKATSAFSGSVDKKALSFYERNVSNIIALCHRQQVLAAFVPQVLNYAKLTQESSYGWLPFVRDRDLNNVMDAYNRALKVVAEKDGASFCSSVLKVKFTEADFLDQGHFSASGNKKFARALALDIKSLARSANLSAQEKVRVVSPPSSSD